MGWGSSVFPLLIITASGGFTGLFVYSPGPGAGNLIASISAVAGTDPYGNAYKAGIQTYGNSAAIGNTNTFGFTVEIINGTIFFGAAVITRNADVTVRVASLATVNPFLLVDGPEQGAAGHIQALFQGFSPDGSTSPPQLLIGTVSGAAVLTPVSTAGLEVQGGAGLPVVQLQGSAATVQAINTKVTGDVNNRWQARSDGLLNWGSGAAPADSSLSRGGANLLNVSTADLSVHTAGRGLRVNEGANGKQGTSTLTAGTVVVANTSVTASSRIFLTAQDNNSTGALRVSARTAGTSFTITSSNAGDTGVVGWEIFEPG